MTSRALWTGLGLLALAVSGCRSTQRVAGPLYAPEELPAAPATPSNLEALVVRHAGPVWVYRPRATEGYAVPFYDKRERVEAGGGVRVGWGGRAELLWPGTASSAVLFEEGTVRLGDPARDEPLMRLPHVTRAQLNLTPDDRVVLPGGAVLVGQADEPSGPFLLEEAEVDLYRLVNQSKHEARLLFREVVLHVAPGDEMTFPALGPGSEPRAADPELSQLGWGGMNFEVIGEVVPSAEGASVRLEAITPSRVFTRGVEVRLEAGQSALFSPLGPGPADAATGGGSR